MAIDIYREELVPLAAAPFPGRPHISTIQRWALKGAHGIKLETCVVGGRRYTSREAVAQFVAATTAAANGDPPPRVSTLQRQRAIASAKEDLERSGY